jgi:hypothetical protein
MMTPQSGMIIIFADIVNPETMEPPVTKAL